MCNEYMPPEYAMHGQFLVKSDVFNFGVLVLEIISGRKNSFFRNGENIEKLLSYVSIFIFRSNGTYTPYVQSARLDCMFKWLNRSGKKLKQYPFIFRMWSIKYSTRWSVPISKALILSIKLMKLVQLVGFIPNTQESSTNEG